MSEDSKPGFLIDSYLEWCAGQPVPVISDFGINMMTIDMAPWDFYGMNGAVCLLEGRDDFTSIFGFELPPGAKSRPMRHIYDDVICILSGHGSTVVEIPGGGTHSFEWGENALFSIPLNSQYQHFNGSGREPARMVSTHNFPYIIKLFRNENFIFENPVPFPERHGKDSYFFGEGEMVMLRPGRHQWETNFVPDICNFELKSWEARGKGSSSLRWILSDGTLGCHTSEIMPGSYKKGHFHFGGTNVHTINGAGYSLLWYEGDEDFVRVDWDHGVVVTPPDGMLHQHFNTGHTPSRYLAIQMGTVRYPLTEAKREIWGENVDKSAAEGGAQIEYADQDKRLHPLWLKEIAKNGVTSEMGDIFDE